MEEAFSLVVQVMVALLFVGEPEEIDEMTGGLLTVTLSLDVA